MYLRIAPELYLKRLVVGGFERVYEINRKFRNEGLSTRHNPEFTMLELYLAYADYRDLMDWVEKALRGLAQAIKGSCAIEYQGRDYDLAKPFRRVTVEQAIIERNPELDPPQLRDMAYLRRACERLGIPFSDHDGPGKLQIEIFEKTVEHTLMDPTFVYAYPAEVSPLSRANDADPFLTDRFEFFLAGRELANGFSELNDPEDQAARFRAQVARKDKGDEEAMFYDADYVRALEYGMPPTAGLGVGIDRLVMFFTDSPSIRDVIVFPQLRPEAECRASAIRTVAAGCAHRRVRFGHRRFDGAGGADAALPHEHFMYLGDTARLPYGTKSAQTVARYAVQAAEALVRHGVKCLVVACNTAASVGLARRARAGRRTCRSSASSSRGRRPPAPPRHGPHRRHRHRSHSARRRLSAGDSRTARRCQGAAASHPAAGRAGRRRAGGRPGGAGRRQLLPGATVRR